MEDIKVGQVWEVEIIYNDIRYYTVTLIKDEKIYIIFNGGELFICKNKIIFTDSKLLATYPTWIEAVNSKEFKGK